MLQGFPFMPYRLGSKYSFPPQCELCFRKAFEIRELNRPVVRVIRRSRGNYPKDSLGENPLSFLFRLLLALNPHERQN